MVAAMYPPLSTTRQAQAEKWGLSPTEKQISVRLITRILILVIDFTDGLPARVAVPVARGGGKPELQPQPAACDDGSGQLLRQRRRIRQILGRSEILKLVFRADLLFGLEFSIVADLEAYHIHLSF
jgi:hypothetical protein